MEFLSLSREEIHRLINRTVIKPDYINLFGESFERRISRVFLLPRNNRELNCSWRGSHETRTGWIARRDRKSSSRETIVKAITSFVFSTSGHLTLFSESLISHRCRNGTRESFIVALTFRDSHMQARKRELFISSPHNTLPDQFTMQLVFFPRTNRTWMWESIWNTLKRRQNQLIRWRIFCLAEANERFVFSFRYFEPIESAV